VASRVHRTEGENNPAPWAGLDDKKKSGHGRSVFFLDSLYGTNRELARLLMSRGSIPEKSPEGSGV
jgi:hypothetical protein